MLLCERCAIKIIARLGAHGHVVLCEGTNPGTVGRVREDDVGGAEIRAGGVDGGIPCGAVHNLHPAREAARVVSHVGDDITVCHDPIKARLFAAHLPHLHKEDVLRTHGEDAVCTSKGRQSKSLCRPFLSVKSHSLCWPNLYNQRHDLPAPHIDDAFVRQLDVRADGEREGGKGHDGVVMPIAVFREGMTHIRDLRTEDGERSVGEDARDRQRRTRRDAAVPRDGDTALRPDDGVRRRRHIGRRLPEDEEVVAVVCIGSRRRSVCERRPADERHAAAAVFPMALKDAGEVVRAVLPVNHAAAHGELCPPLRNKGRMLLHLEDAAKHRPLRDRRTQDEILCCARRKMDAPIKMRRK